MPSKPQHSPHAWTAPAYWQKRQYTKTRPPLPALSDACTNIIQQKNGSILYYAQVLDYTMLPALSDISQTQAKPTEHTQDEMAMLMDYCATYLSSIIRFYASNMILHIDTDAAYLVAPGAKIRIPEHYYLSNLLGKLHNPPFHIVWKFIKYIVTSAAKAEQARTFLMARRSSIFGAYYALLDIFNHLQFWKLTILPRFLLLTK